MSPPAWAAFMAASGTGAALRHLVDGYGADGLEGTFPLGHIWDTLVGNATGSLLLSGLALYHGSPMLPR